MKHIKILCLLLFASSIGFSQTTIYSEDFTNQNGKGATGPTATIDLVGVDWTLDVSAATLDQPNNDWFQVASSRFEGRDIDGTGIWLSPVIDISGYTNVEFSLDAAEAGVHEADDTYVTEYRIDGGAWATDATNGSLNDDFLSAVVSRTGLAGNSLELRVTLTNNASSERFRIDNVLVEGIDPVTSTIVVNPNFVTDMNYVQGETSIIEDSFTIQGFALTTDIVLTAPANFEISTTTGTGFGTSVNLTPVTGSVGLTTIYTRLISGLTVNTYGGTITATSTGATSKNITASGEVTTPIADCSELLISEYHEGENATPNERYIEIYNPTNATVDLTNYRLATYNNSNLNPNNTLDLSGTLGAYSTFVVSRDNSTLCISGDADLCTTSNVFNFTGNDAVALQTIAGTDIDIVGLIGNSTNFGRNTVLRRNADVLIPTVAYDDTQWSTAGVNDTSLLGTHISECSCTGVLVTWDGSVWSNGTGPIASSPVEINGPFDTNLAGQTSFSACSLTINAEVIIGPSTFIEIENNITNNAKIIIQDQGSLVQINESSIFINGTSPEVFPIEVIKRTAPLVDWFEYTYWSSPLQAATLEDLLPNTSSVRKFYFEAANFNDLTAESMNDNATNPGQDDIDDDANDWQYASGVMTPGTGYAATMAPLDLTGPGGGASGILKTFYGETANSGEIIVPIFRNDLTNLDNNWNLIGNPYPSAIDASAFFNLNATTNGTIGTVDPGTIDGAIYFWSHTTAPSANTNGNEPINFDINDYAIINFTANIAGEQYTPNNFIPSGQGFFVNFSDAFATNTADVIFNNSMRVTGDNDQFFKSNSTQQNKLWLNLTSDNGVFSQTAVGYVNGATNNDDGPSYDARRFYNGGSAMLVSFANNSSVPLAIQGKEPNTLDLDEVIPLGFTTGITSPTLYKISINNVQGDFLTNNTMYLKDNSMSVFHDLTASDYTFTSNDGEFNDRFEIVFKVNTLSVDDLEATSSNLSIIELDNNLVQFSISQNDLTISKVKIYDVNGRLVYDLKGFNNVEVYNLSNLSQAPFIALIELSNGQIISKKSIKK